MPERLVGHVDMDAFYVSVELQSRPELRGQPVVVAGRGPRAVVTTASYEARRFGIFSATPAERARRLCPDATFIPPDFKAYREHSREVMDVLREHIDRVEVVGLDEAYLDLSGLTNARAAARRVKAAVRERTGLGCSVGIGPNKLVAKVASDAEKPDGFVCLTQAHACERFAAASPALLPGIGPKTVARLEAYEVRTVGELAGLSERQLAGWFGERLGPHLRSLARFEDERPLALTRTPKSESRETTFDRDLTTVASLEDALSRLSGELCAALTEQRRAGRTIAIKVRFADFSTHTRARTSAEPTNDPARVFAVARDLLHELGPQRPVRLLGVRVAAFHEAAPPQPRPAGQLDLPL